MDVVDPAKRSEMMAGIKSKNTKPEMLVRKFLHSEGFRYRLHSRKLPGSPDIVLPKYKKAIFVHGCFWHRHLNCKYATMPSSNVDRWRAKFQENVDRDIRTRSALEESGWKVIVVWECELRSSLANRLNQLVREILSKGPLINNDLQNCTEIE
jgi:DNA mismatch endonuclease (patch repair protein)